MRECKHLTTPSQKKKTKKFTDFIHHQDIYYESLAHCRRKKMGHVLLFPFPAQGHIPPMLNLAELLSHAGVYVTILLTEHTHARLSCSSKALQRFSRVPRVRFRTIPDGLPEEDPRPFYQLMQLEETMRMKCRERYRELLVSVDDGQGIGAWPPVTCVVADGFLPLGLEVAEETKIPTMILRTSSACSVWAYYSIPELIRRGEFPFDGKILSHVCLR